MESKVLPYAQAKGRGDRESPWNTQEIKSSSLLKIYFAQVAQILPESALETMSPTPDAYEEQKT